MKIKWFFAVFFSVAFVFLAVFGVSCVYGYVFPMKFKDEVFSASEVFDVDAAIILSVINIESHFRKEVVSSKGAVGLMQVMPSTAEEVATENKFGEFDLKVPKDNISIGTCYLAKLIKQFENLETALCAYNAGPKNVRSWLSDASLSDDGITLKNIPFSETKRYIEKFRQNYKYYKSKV